MIFKTLFRPQPKKLPEDRLPAVHGFVEVTVGGRGLRSVPVEEIGAREIVVGEVVGRSGESGVFIYHNPAGKFRFATKIIELRAGMTVFALPERIESLGGGGGAQKRSSVRLDTLLPGMWRLAPSGRGVGDFLKGSIRDISRGGCSLIADRPFKIGATVEVKLAVRQNGPPLTVLGEVVRSEQIPTSGKFSHGLRFQGLSPDESHAILEYINRKLAELRSRGLA